MNASGNNAEDSVMPEVESREFRIAARYRRAALFGVLWATSWAVPIWKELVDLGPGFLRWDELLESSATLALAIGLLVLSLRWCVRIDSRGISRRNIAGWDLWPWSAFQSGRVWRAAWHDSYHLPEKPWGRRTLVLAFLDAADHALVAGVCDRLWVAPLAPDTSDDVAFVHPVDFRFSPLRGEVRLTSEGIHRRRRRDRYCRWEDVREVRISRIDHRQPGFDELELHLPGGKLRLEVESILGFRRLNWKGASAELISAKVLRHMPARRVTALARYGPPLNRQEAQKRLRDLDAESWVDHKWFTIKSILATLIAVALGILAGRLLLPLLPFGPLPQQWRFALGLLVLDWLVWLVVPLWISWVVHDFRTRRRQIERDRLNQWIAGAGALLTGDDVDTCDASL